MKVFAKYINKDTRETDITRGKTFLVSIRNDNEYEEPGGLWVDIGDRYKFYYEDYELLREDWSFNENYMVRT